ncbi:MAG: PilZ domain-containing protein [Treponema sp.]|nr:PilZ domain-containing protein [Treponema sp.]
MNVSAGFRMFPLQMIEDFWQPAEELGAQTILFLVGVGTVIAILVIVSILKNRGNFSALSEGRVNVRSRRRAFSAFTMHRISSELGLDREKTKMLEFVLKNDNVTDPMKSLDSPDLMDRHFKRAYRLIEKTSISEDELNSRLSVLFATRNIIENYTDTATVTSTRQIYDNTMAMVIQDGHSYETRVISSQGETLIIEHPVNSKGSPLAIPKGSKINIAFFNKSSKGFSVTSRVIDSIETMNRRILKLAHSNKIKKLSNRRFRRRQTIISTGFYLVNVDTALNRKEKRLLVDKRQFVGSIMDISVGGCSIKTGAPIKAGQKIKIEFTREDNFTVAALGEVLRTNRTGFNTVMHIKFLKIPRKSLNFINAMVYEYAEN